jgi:hypothetical protein
MSDGETDPTENAQPDAAAAAPAQSGLQPGLIWAPPAAPAAPSGRGRTARLFASAVTAWIVAGMLALAVVGLSVALALANSGPIRLAPIVQPAPGSGTAPRPVAPGSPRTPSPLGGRFGNRGVVGTVTGIGFGTFTVKGVGGQTVTVDEQSSTTYDQGATSAGPSAVVMGARVLVVGSRSGNTVQATRVIVLPPGGFGGGGGAPGFGGFTGPAPG